MIMPSVVRGYPAGSAAAEYSARYRFGEGIHAGVGFQHVGEPHPGTPRQNTPAAGYCPPGTMMT